MARGKRKYLTQDAYRHDHYATHWGFDFDRYSSHRYYGSFGGFYNFDSPIYGPGLTGLAYRRPIRGAWMHGSNHTTHIPAPPLSQLDTLVTSLETLIAENKPQELATLLRKDFIFEYQQTLVEENFHTNTASEVQGHVYTYQLCDAQPNIEFLILKHNAIFRSLLEKAKEADLKNPTLFNSAAENSSLDSSTSLYRCILRELKQLDLQGADLSGLDLDEADLSHSNCKKADFKNSSLNKALAFQSDLRETNLTKKQLNSFKSYDAAQVNSDFWPYWTESTKNNVLAGLTELKRYGQKLKAEGSSKGEAAIKLADKLEADIKQPTAKYNESFQRQFLRDLHSQDRLFDGHRSYTRIIANIALCVVSGIVGYLIAGAINKKLTGHFTFFAKTTTRKKVETIDQAFPHTPSPMSTFLLGTHPRLGKKSQVYSHFGHKKNKSVHPLGDPQTLPLIKQFLY
jgi:uncharacterized protein YjbI with pentapeptide repeats